MKLFIPLLLLLTGVAGCSGHEPKVEPPETPDVVQGVPAIPSPALGASVSYALDPSFNAGHHVATTTTIEVRGDMSAVLDYRHPEYPQFDSTLEGFVGLDGSWDAVNFGCEPVFPDRRNSACNAARGGYAKGMNLDGPFFGGLLISGLLVGENRTFSRVFDLGTQTTTSWFKIVNETNSSITVGPVRSVDPLVYDFGHANTLDPVHCSVFSGQLVLSKEDGYPERCEFTKEGRTFTVWNRTTTQAGSGPVFSVSPPSELPSGTFRWPAETTGSTPFPLAVALRTAGAEDESVAGALANPQSWLGSSTMVLTSATQTGACPACVITTTWTWDLRIHSPDKTIEFAVTKTVDSVTGNPAYTYASKPDKPAIPFPRGFPAQLVSDVDVWESARSTLGFSPFGLIFQQPRSGTAPFVELTGFTEPYYAIVFSSSEENGGLPPQIWFRSDGALEVFMADGAQPDPVLSQQESGPCVFGCSKCLKLGKC